MNSQINLNRREFLQTAITASAAGALGTNDSDSLTALQTQSSSQQPERNLNNMDAYRAICMQLRCDAVSSIKDKAEARAVMKKSLERMRGQILAGKQFLGDDVMFAVLPEYFLTGFPLGEPIPVWGDKAAFEMNGAEYEALGKIAQDGKLFIAGSAYELDPKFPGLYFQCNFLIEPSGNVILRYRRLNSMFAPTPHDVWDKYLEVYGLEGVFPVAKTPIGNIAAIASEEILYPEIARCHVMRGAEVFFHPTSQANEHAKAVKEICTVARAIENCAYVISSNTGGYYGTNVPPGSTDGGSRIVNYNGVTLAYSGSGETWTAVAEIDLAALRRFRRKPGMDNLLARQRFEAYAESYAKHQHYPANNMKGVQPDRAHFLKTQRETIERLAKAGVI